MKTITKRILSGTATNTPLMLSRLESRTGLHRRCPDLGSELKANEHGAFAYREYSMFMQPDFEQPEFYKEMFKSWGLGTK